MKKTKKAQAKIVNLAISKLRFAPYQNSRRKSAVAWVRKRKLDSTKLGVIDVSYRDGVYWVIDGMARVLLLKEEGETHIRAVVNRGLTYEEEAKRFVVLNKERRTTTPFQEFYGEFEARDPTVVAIVKLCKTHSYDMLTDTPGEGVLRCYNQIRRIVALPDGMALLDQVFAITRRCWGAFGGTTLGDMFRGLVHFIQQHGHVPGAVDRLEAKLLGIHPKTVQAQAYLKRGGNSGSGGHRTIYATFVEIHNKRYSPKLPTCLRTPLKKKASAQVLQAAAAAEVVTASPELLASLRGRFKRDGRGSGFPFRRGGAKRLAKRLRSLLGDQTAGQFVGSKDAKLFRPYAQEQRQKLSPRFAELCEEWGVEYQDTLVPKKKAAPVRRTKKAAPVRQAKTVKKGGNGHAKAGVGEVIFDATSSKSILEQIA